LLWRSRYLLTGNPQITFFKVVYRRHTNFAMECVEQTLSGTSTSTNAGSDVNCTATVSRNGDLVGKMYVTSSTAGITDGADLVKQVDVEIGGQRIDRHYKEWMQVWSELSTPDSKAIGVKAMTGCVGTSGGDGVGMVQVPLQFWFNRNPGLALPLIALQYHEVKIKLTLGSASGVAAACKLWADYIYLDTDERRRFAQVSHEYLIEQLQREESASGTSHKLNFNHPVKELVWTSVATNSYNTAKLVLNGHDRFAAQEEEYFQLRQPFDHHTAIPGQNIPQLDTPNMLREPITVSALNLQALAGNNAAALDSALDTDDDAIIGVMSDTTNAATVTENGNGLKSLTIRQATATTFKVGDLLNISIHSGVEGGSVSNTNTRQYEVQSILINTAETADKTYTSLTLDRNIFMDDTVENDDDLEVRIVGRSAGRCRTSQMTKKINCYSFALKPEEHQPSGTCNFSRIDNAQLTTGSTGTALLSSDNIYAVNYNVLRVMSGMGGLAYSN